MIQQFLLEGEKVEAKEAMLIGKTVVMNLSISAYES
jgi:hypothetical protein